MNIFYLDKCAQKSAQYMCNAHVVKMILETAQILSTVHHTKGSNNNILYKQTHVNHPCSIWARQSLYNYLWLCNHGLFLCKEYEFRYGKIHASKKIISWCLANRPNFDRIEFSPPPQAMPEEFKHADAVIAYRQYYHEKARTLKKFEYKNRSKPSWLCV